ncbi:hypothetical protein NFI96_019398, partial [Prochilodus magdalenae]
MAATEKVQFEQLSRRHGVKIAPGVKCSVEECSLAVGEVVGYGSILSASRMNSAVVLFLDSIEKANALVQTGVVIQGTFTPVVPLIRPAKKITLSNEIPPFIKDEVLTAELTRYGQLMSPMRKIPLGSKSPLLKHVVCFRRQILMVLKSGIEKLNVAFKFKIDGFDYVVFATSDTMKCFGCGREGHLRRSCPSEAGEGTSRASDSAPAGGSAAGVDPEPGQEPVSGAVGTEMGLGAAHVGVTDGSDTQSQVSEGGEVAEPVVANSSTIGIGDALQEGSGSQGDGVTVAGTGVDAVALAESILEGEGMEMDAVAEETLFKVPSGKRKMRRTKTVGKKGQAQRAGGAQGKKHEMNPGSGSGSLDDSDSDLPDAKSQRSQRSEYAFDKIRSFLNKTKNMKGVVVKDHFSDRSARSMARLEDEILELRSLVDSTRDQGHVRALKLKTSALGDLLGIRAQGALVRSRFQKLTQMDAPSRFFFSLERKNGQSRFIHSLCSEDGRELTEPTEIRKRAVRFYAELYGSEFRDDEDLAVGFYAGLLPNWSQNALNELLERPLGLCRSSMLLYRAWTSWVLADLLAVLTESLAVGFSLPLSCRRAVITLLPKKGNLQDIRELATSESPLHGPLKVFSKALANKVTGCDGAGHPIWDQTYCVPGDPHGLLLGPTSLGPTRTVKLQNLVDVSGPGLDDIQAVASLLGLRGPCVTPRPFLLLMEGQAYVGRAVIVAGL